ncbi:MAG TPA: UrcA family protein [Steroidobacteraceae bacterium]|nr:UrcA family protein [Steroidobacteraceae bacterium]
MKTKLNMTVGFTVLAIALAFSSGVFAESPSFVNSASKTVHYQDLNLSTPKGIQVLYRRLQVVAASECAQVASDPYYAYLECTQAAMDAAVRAVGNADLTAMHHGMKRRALVAAR